MYLCAYHCNNLSICWSRKQCKNAMAGKSASAGALLHVFSASTRMRVVEILLCKHTCFVWWCVRVYCRLAPDLWRFKMECIRRKNTAPTLLDISYRSTRACVDIACQGVCVCVHLRFAFSCRDYHTAIIQIVASERDNGTPWHREALTPEVRISNRRSSFFFKFCEEQLPHMGY